MLSFIIIILCINIDAFSYGVAYGFKKQKLNIFYIFCVTLLSTILFTIPLIISRYVFNLFNPLICHLINGAILIALGIYYFLQKQPEIYENNSKNIKNRFKSDKNYNLKNFENNKKKVNKYRKNPNKIGIKQYIIETFVISVDAIFTALLSGFSSNFMIFYIFFYAFSNFFAIFLGNIIFYYTNKKLKIKLSYFSGIIFIFLGILKCFGI